MKPTMWCGCIKCALSSALLILLLPSPRLQGADVSGCGGLLFESYNTGAGTAVSVLTSHPTFPNSPRERLRLLSFDTREVYPDGSHGGYGARIRGLFIPPASANWIFYLRSDNASQLFLSSDAAAFNKVLIVQENTCCNPFSSRASAPIPLQAGMGYYIEVLYKEGTGDDYAQVAVKMTSDPTNPNTLSPIPGSYLGYPTAPAGIGGPLSITQQPVNATVTEHNLATFSVAAINPNGLPLCYQWSTSVLGGPFTDIPGETGSSYTLVVSRADNGSRFRCTVGVIGSNAQSSEAILTVLAPPDVTQPGDPIVPSSNNSPAESVANAIDNNQSTKYLNFDRLNTGFTVTPSLGSTIVSGLTLRSANDAPERDPASHRLEGSRNGTDFFQISEGPVATFTARFQKKTNLFDNAQAYTAYRLIFPTVVGPGGNSMQIAEVELLGIPAPSPVFINEWLANSDLPLLDYIELYNSGASPVDLSGHSLTDNLGNPMKFVFPFGTIIPAGGFLVFDENQLGFSLSANGESIGLFTPGGLVMDSVTFGPQQQNVSEGRWPDGETNIIVLSARTPGSRNMPILGINSPPFIGGQPQSRQPLPGSSVILSVATASASTARYQWRRTGFRIVGATNASLIITNVQAADGGEYSVVVANDVGEGLSTPATLVVDVPLMPPADNFLNRVALSNTLVRGSNIGATNEFGEPRHAGKPGGSSVWYRWIAPSNGIARFNTRGSTFDTLLAVYTGANLLTLTSGSVAYNDDKNGFYTSEVQFNASAGTEYQIAIEGHAGAQGHFVLNSDLEPTAQTLPIIVTQPTNKRVFQGGNATLAVSATGSGLTYAWLYGGTPILGATSSTLTLTNVQLEDVGAYSVRVRNALGRVVESKRVAIEIGPAELPCNDKLEELISGGSSAFFMAPDGWGKGRGPISIAGSSVTATSIVQIVMETTGAGYSQSEITLCSIPDTTTWHELPMSDTNAIFRIDAAGTTSMPKLAVFESTYLANVVCGNQSSLANSVGSMANTICFQAAAFQRYFLQVTSSSDQIVTLTYTVGLKLFMTRAPTTNHLIISWCAPSNAYRLEATNYLVAPPPIAWQPVTPPPSFDKDINSFELNATGQLRFFRLMKNP